jgi:hypothetical protein
VYVAVEKTCKLELLRTAAEPSYQAWLDSGAPLALYELRKYLTLLPAGAEHGSQPGSSSRGDSKTAAAEGEAGHRSSSSSPVKQKAGLKAGSKPAAAAYAAGKAYSSSSNADCPLHQLHDQIQQQLQANVQGKSCVPPVLTSSVISIPAVVQQLLSGGMDPTTAVEGVLVEHMRACVREFYKPFSMLAQVDAPPPEAVAALAALVRLQAGELFASFRLVAPKLLCNLLQLDPPASKWSVAHGAQEWECEVVEFLAGHVAGFVEGTIAQAREQGAANEGGCSVLLQLQVAMEAGLRLGSSTVTKADVEQATARVNKVAQQQQQGQDAAAGRPSANTTVQLSVAAAHAVAAATALAEQTLQQLQQSDGAGTASDASADTAGASTAAAVDGSQQQQQGQDGTSGDASADTAAAAGAGAAGQQQQQQHCQVGTASDASADAAAARAAAGSQQQQQGQDDASDAALKAAATASVAAVAAMVDREVERAFASDCSEDADGGGSDSEPLSEEEWDDEPMPLTHRGATHLAAAGVL